jgi:tRNA nucleotidyltransferase/poly(A) polymerase
MKLSKKVMLFFLVLLLIILSVLLFKVKLEKVQMQKRIDLVFINAISDSMDGLSKDYVQMDSEQKIQYYYKTLYNLHDALEVLYASSYNKKYDNLVQTLNRLYIYLLKKQGENYEIEDAGHIFEFLGKILVYPYDNQKISDFNSFLDSKNK